MAKADLTVARLHESLHYSPETGVFTWLLSPQTKVKAGDVAGTVCKRGYVNVQLDGVLYRAARLAWFYVHGVWPSHDVDHVNQVKGDNRLSNLRDVPSGVNKHNQTKANKGSTVPLLGVYWRKDRGTYFAKIGMRGKSVHLGTFSNPEAAHAAYMAVKRQLAELPGAQR
jgi:hypothetical protein